MAFGKLARTAWRKTPPPIRERALEMLCALCVRRRAPAQDREEPPRTLCVAGFFRAPTGLGLSAGLYAEEAERAGKRVLRIDLTSAFFQTAMPDLDRADSFTVDAALHSLHKHGAASALVVHVNPPMFLYALWKLRRLATITCVVGYWAWEMETLPHIWRRCLRFVDRVETPSGFTASAIQRHTEKPVSVHPHALSRALPQGQARPFTEDGYVRVLYIFDTASNSARKNPLAVITAFKKAFAGNGNAKLTLKANKLDAFPEVARALREAARGDDSIDFLTGYVSREEVRQLYRNADIYLSLHRSEGYGLTLHEAMLHGLYVVGTGWSGNCDFMRGPRCFIVPYTLVPARDTQKLFTGKGARWAEADSDATAAILRGICAEESFPLARSQ